MVSFPQVSQSEPCAHLSPPPYAPHAHSVELHNELLKNYFENMLKEEVVVHFEVIFQNFRRRDEKIHEKSQINVASLGVEI